VGHYLIDRKTYWVIEERTQAPLDAHTEIGADLAKFPIEALDILEVNGRVVASLNENKLEDHLKRIEQKKKAQAEAEEQTKQVRLEAEKRVREKVRRKSDRAERIKELAKEESGLLRELIDQLLDD
jgi:hypothetical protein